MSTKKSDWFDLPGVNKYQIEIQYEQNPSDGSNKVDFSYYFNSKYRVSGESWVAWVKIDGKEVMRHNTKVAGGGSSSGVHFKWKEFSKTFTYSGSKTIKVDAGFDINYYDVKGGVSTRVVRTDVFSFNIKLDDTNKSPSKPTITRRNTKIGERYVAEDKLRIDFSEVADPDGDNVYYRLYMKSKPPKGNWTEYKRIFNKESREVSYNIENYARGTEFCVYGKATDENGASSANTSELRGIFRNYTPTKPGAISPSSGVLKSNPTLKWGKSTDGDGQTVTYDMYCSKNGGSYTKVKSGITTTSYTYDISKDKEGTTYKFKVCSNDGMTTSDFSESGKFTKNQKPTTPSKVFPNSGYYLGKVNISWNASKDPDGTGIEKYDIYINNSYVGSSVSSPYGWTIPSGDAEGKEYLASVIAKDKDGGYSDTGTATGKFKKAYSPVKPSIIMPEDTYHESNIPLWWSSVESNGNGTTYQLEYRVNDGSWTSINDKLTKNEYDHKITNIERGSEIQYRVQVKNSFGQVSGWKESKKYVRNTLPYKPKLICPINNSSLFDTTPRIAFSIQRDEDGQDQIIYATVNSIVYSSAANPNMFSKTSGVFNCDSDIVFFSPELNKGENTFSMFVNDGLANGPALEFKYTVEDYTDTVTNEDFINESVVNRIRTHIQNTRKSYALEPYNFKTKVIKGGLIKADHFIEMQSAIKEPRDKVNAFDSNSVGDINADYSSITLSDYITAEHMKEIIGTIKHV